MSSSLGGPSPRKIAGSVLINSRTPLATDRTARRFLGLFGVLAKAPHRHSFDVGCAIMPPLRREVVTKCGFREARHNLQTMPSPSGAFVIPSKKQQAAG